MSCFRPMAAFRTNGGEVKLGVAPPDCRSMQLPCGRCIGCKLDRARAWTVRITHEAQLYDSNLFLTLTYREDALPKSLSLEYPHFAGFMKRLRSRMTGVSVGADGRKPVRFFCAGEYGERTGRPHFHAILFNVRFPDAEKFRNGTLHSRMCEDLWQLGNVVIGSVNGRSAAYVAGYTLKKAHGQAAQERYEDVVSLRTGEVFSRRPPFVVMSRRPGIGAGWYEKFRKDLFPVDHAILEGKKYKVPRYYLERFRVDGDPCLVEEILHGRYLRAAEQREEGKPERLAVREECAQRRSAIFDERGL